LSREPRLANIDGREALLLDGAVQSVAPGGDADGYWPLLLPRERPANALLLGLGGGTVARLLLERYGPLPIVGVDSDARVLALARASGWLDDLDLAIVLADARTFVAGCAARGARFALVVVDLFGAGAVPDWVCGRGFLTLLAAIVAKDGVLTVNLSRGAGHEQRLRAIERRFVIERVAAIGMNLAVHARPRPTRHYRRDADG
jgi:spermidine synthase